MNRLLRLTLLCAATTLAACATMDRAPPGKPEYMIVGIDNKTTWDAGGKLVLSAPGKDVVAIVDIGTDPANPKIVTTLPLSNSIFGPPTNLAITPNGQLALVADSVEYTADGSGWKSGPDNRLHVIDLTTNPPRLIETITVSAGSRPACRSTAPATSH